MNKPACILIAILVFVLGGLLHINEASAGCRINIKARNDSSSPVNLSRHDSKVKVKGGTWKKVFGVNDDLRVEPHSNFDYVYKASFGCNVKRRWLFTLIDGEGCTFEYAWYKPSADGWFAKGVTDISLHELSGKCNR